MTSNSSIKKRIILQKKTINKDDKDLFDQSSLREKMLKREVKMFQTSRRSCVAIPIWSGYPVSYILIATWVSYTINAENNPTAT